PLGGTSASSSARSSPSRRGRTQVSQGRWSACRAGSWSVRRLATSSHSGEKANRIPATSSGFSTHLTVMLLVCPKSFAPPFAVPEPCRVTTTAPPEPSFLRATFGGLPRPFWALWGGTLVNRLGTMVMPFTGVFLTQARGLSLAAAGLVMAVFGAGSLLSQLLAGVLADRIGRRATLAGGMVATAAALLALGYSTTLPAILASMLLLGLVVDAYRPASNALVADLVSPENRPRAFGLLFWAINLGYSIGMTAGGWLAEQDFLLLFWLDAVSCVIFAALVWRAVPETRPRGKPEAGGFGVVLRDRLMVAFTLVVLGNALVYSQTFTTLPMAMTERAGLTTGQFGTAM